MHSKGGMFSFGPAIEAIFGLAKCALLQLCAGLQDDKLKMISIAKLCTAVKPNLVIVRGNEEWWSYPCALLRRGQRVTSQDATNLEYRTPTIAE